MWCGGRVRWCILLSALGYWYVLGISYYCTTKYILLLCTAAAAAVLDIIKIYFRIPESVQVVLPSVPDTYYEYSKYYRSTGTYTHYCYRQEFTHTNLPGQKGEETQRIIFSVSVRL